MARVIVEYRGESYDVTTLTNDSVNDALISSWVYKNAPVDILEAFSTTINGTLVSKNHVLKEGEGKIFVED